MEYTWPGPVQISLSKQKCGPLRIENKDKIDLYSYDEMIVLTPNDKLENTSYRVKYHNFQVIYEELSEAHKLLKRLAPVTQIQVKSGINPEETKES